MQQLQPLCLQLVGEQIDPGEIAAWAGEAADETQSGGVFSYKKYDWNRRSGCFGRQRRARPSRRDNYRGLSAHQLSSYVRQMVQSIFRPAVGDCDVLTFGKAEFFEALTKPSKTVCHLVRRSAVEKPNNGHCRLLSARRQRPCRRTAKQGDDLAPLHDFFQGWCQAIKSGICGERNGGQLAVQKS